MDMEQSIADNTSKPVQAEPKYPPLPLTGLILTAMMFITFGITLPYAVGIGIACLVRLISKPRNKFPIQLLYVAAFVTPLVVCCFLGGQKVLSMPINLAVFSIMGLYFIFMTFNAKSIISDILITCIVLLPLISYLWFLAGLGALDYPEQINIFLVSQRISIHFLSFLTLIVVIRRLVVSYRDNSTQVFKTVIRVLLLIAILKSPAYKFSDKQAFLKGFEKTVRTNLDITAIENWLRERPAPQIKPESDEDSVIDITLDEQPDYVKKISNGETIKICYDWNKQQFYISRGSSILFLFCFYWRVYISPEGGENLRPLSGEAVFITPSTYIWCDYSS